MAEVILIGLKILERSEPGLKLLWTFLEEEGFPRTGTKYETRQWKDERMNYFRKISLSDGKKKIIKNFIGCEAGKDALEKRTDKKVADLVRRSA